MLHNGTHLALIIVSNNRVCSTTGDCFSALTLQQGGQLFINSVTLFAYDVADIMDDYSYTTVLESFVSTSSMHVAWVNTKKVSGLNHLLLVKKWCILPKKALNRICCTT